MRFYTFLKNSLMIVDFFFAQAFHFIRMMFQSTFAKRFLELFGRRMLRHTQYTIVIFAVRFLLLKLGILQFLLILAIALILAQRRLKIGRCFIPFLHLFERAPAIEIRIATVGVMRGRLTTIRHSNLVVHLEQHTSLAILVHILRVIRFASLIANASGNLASIDEHKRDQMIVCFIHRQHIGVRFERISPLQILHLSLGILQQSIDAFDFFKLLLDRFMLGIRLETGLIVLECQLLLAQLIVGATTQ
mmetsp:Transcript_38626/g.63261  ORF Transcript_38626/g.63261 Transcript_38626/m.63261 type:complete len:247 (+) Transcript_38626:205-945(+)